MTTNNQPHYLIIHNLPESGPSLMRETELKNSGPGRDVKVIYRIEPYGDDYILVRVDVEENPQPRFQILGPLGETRR